MPDPRDYLDDSVTYVRGHVRRKRNTGLYYKGGGIRWGKALVLVAAVISIGFVVLVMAPNKQESFVDLKLPAAEGSTPGEVYIRGETTFVGLAVRVSSNPPIEVPWTVDLLDATRVTLGRWEGTTTPLDFFTYTTPGGGTYYLRVATFSQSDHLVSVSITNPSGGTAGVGSWKVVRSGSTSLSIPWWGWLALVGGVIGVLAIPATRVWKSTKSLDPQMNPDSLTYTPQARPRSPEPVRESTYNKENLLRLIWTWKPHWKEQPESRLGKPGRLAGTEEGENYRLALYLTNRGFHSESEVFLPEVRKKVDIVVASKYLIECKVALNDWDFKDLKDKLQLYRPLPYEKMVVIYGEARKSLLDRLDSEVDYPFSCIVLGRIRNT